MKPSEARVARDLSSDVFFFHLCRRLGKQTTRRSATHARWVSFSVPSTPLILSPFVHMAHSKMPYSPRWQATSEGYSKTAVPSLSLERFAAARSRPGSCGYGARAGHSEKRATKGEREIGLHVPAFTSLRQNHTRQPTFGDSVCSRCARAGTSFSIVSAVSVSAPYTAANWA